MKYVKNLIILFVILFSFNLIAKESKAVRLCYFSLNNEKEFHVMEKMVSDLQKKYNSDTKIEVKEYLTQNDNPEDAFKKMVESGERCDGLVISGHHTGSFGGKRASGSLGIDFLEQISCDEKYKEWFDSINAVWLQGCRTLGVKQGGANDTADFHTERVGNFLEEDGLEQGSVGLNFEFSATLDQDNPLSSRYLRVFPFASIFGWTKTAPGEKARSEYSLPFHLAQMIKLKEKENPQNPTKEISKDAAKYFTTLLDILNTSSKENNCVELRQNACEAWICHGNCKNGGLGFNNPDLESYQPLILQKNPVFDLAKELDCALKNSNNESQILSMLDKILKDEKVFPYVFNGLWGLLQKLKKEGNIALYDKVKEKFKESPLLIRFVEKKLKDSKVGLLPKLDYYSFYRQFMDKDFSAIDDEIEKGVLKILLRPATNYDQRDFQKTLLASLVKNEFSRIGKMFKTIIDSKDVTPEMLGSVANAIGYSELPIAGADAVLKQIIDSPKSNSYTCGRVADAIGNSKLPIAGADAMLKQIIDSPKSNEFTLGYVAGAIGNSRFPIAGVDAVLKQIIDSPKAEVLTLANVANAIGNSKFPIAGADAMLKQIIDYPKSNEYTLGRVADAIGNSIFPITDAGAVLKQIINSPKADGDTLMGVVDAIGNSKFPIEGSKEILNQIINNSRFGDETKSKAREVLNKINAEKQ